MRAMRIRGSSPAEEDYHPYLALRSIGDRRRGGAADRTLPRPDEPAMPAAALGRASLWSEIEAEAVEMAAREPMLRQTIDEAGFDAAPARIVSAVLSCRLASAHRSAIPHREAVSAATQGCCPSKLSFAGDQDLKASTHAQR